MSVTTVVHLKELKAGLEHRLKLAETSMHARGTSSRRTQDKLKSQISALHYAIEAMTVALQTQVDATKPPLKSFTSINLFCHAGAVEDAKKHLSSKGYSWSLNRYPNFTNEFREYEFNIMAIANFSTNTLEPQ